MLGNVVKLAVKIKTAATIRCKAQKTNQTNTFGELV
jgi:hypothetical protein